MSGAHRRARFVYLGREGWHLLFRDYGRHGRTISMLWAPMVRAFSNDIREKLSTLAGPRCQDLQASDLEPFIPHYARAKLLADTIEAASDPPDWSGLLGHVIFSTSWGSVKKKSKSILRGMFISAHGQVYRAIPAWMMGFAANCPPTPPRQQWANTATSVWQREPFVIDDEPTFLIGNHMVHAFVRAQPPEPFAHPYFTTAAIPYRLLMTENPDARLHRDLRPAGDRRRVPDRHRRE